MRITLIICMLIAAYAATMPKMQGKSIIIGDSHAALIAQQCPGLQLLSHSGTGWGTKSLYRSLAQETAIRGVAKCYVTIGTNDNYSQKGLPTLIHEIKTTFPGAEIIYIPGSIGWGGVTNTTPKTVQKYAEVWRTHGCTILPCGVGASPTHPSAQTEGIQEIAKYINE